MTANSSCDTTTKDTVSFFTSLAGLGPQGPETYGPGASYTVRPPRHAAMARQQPLPPEYRLLSPDELEMRIRDARARLGRRLVILGHHYQRDEIIKHADVTGVAFKLSQ